MTAQRENDWRIISFREWHHTRTLSELLMFSDTELFTSVITVNTAGDSAISINLWSALNVHKYLFPSVCHMFAWKIITLARSLFLKLSLWINEVDIISHNMLMLNVNSTNNTNKLLRNTQGSYKNKSSLTSFDLHLFNCSESTFKVLFYCPLLTVRYINVAPH